MISPQPSVAPNQSEAGFHQPRNDITHSNWCALAVCCHPNDRKEIFTSFPSRGNRISLCLSCVTFPTPLRSMVTGSSAALLREKYL